MKTSKSQGQERASIESQLLTAITRAQSEFVVSRDARPAFDGMLDALLRLTESEYAFIGEVIYEDDGSPYLKTHAITNIAWDEETQKLYDKNIEQGLEFRNMNTLFGKAITTGSVVIANDPPNDSRRGGVPKGHPPLNAFLGVPLYYRGKLIGMVGVANREQGYSRDLVDAIEPLWSNFTTLILALRARTRRGTVEKNLRESEARGRAILDTAVDAIITIDEKGRIETCNKAAGRIFGYGTNELVSMNVRQLMPMNHAEKHDSYIQNYMGSGRARIIGVGRELIAKRRDGSEFPIELIVNEIKLEGRRTFVGMMRDISEQKSNEEQRSKLTKELTHRVDELDRLNEEKTLLSGLGSYLQACSSKEEAYDVLLAHVRVLFPNESGAFYTLSETSNSPCVLSWGDEQEILSDPVQKHDCWALRRGVAHETSEAGASLRCRHYNGIEAGNQFCIPVMTQNGPIGLLTLHVPADSIDDDEEQSVEHSLSLISGIADRLGPALSGIELRGRLHEDSIRDPLTKLYNRRFMNESLHREMRRASRANAPLSLIILDLDHFKEINDEYGHDVGDDVLMTVARKLTNAVREEDYVCRYGGEEFVIVLPGARQDAARDRAQQACRDIRALRVDTEKGRLHVTISAGVATFPEHGKTQDELLVQADKALYLAKQSGRDRIELAEVAQAS